MEDEENNDSMVNSEDPETRRHTNGRDELNLADFPISVLQWQQPTDDEGRKVQRIVYQSTRYDPVAHRRVPQQVTLSSEEGLPTPADEKIVLALLYLSKKANDFTEPKVHFHPHQLFQVIGWSSNSRSYERLRSVLRRLKALTLRYENAWWDSEGREYEEEFATGIIASYLIARLTRGRKKAADVPSSWVQWHPDFFKSLAHGNLKRLDLERLFALRLPISQRMFRFLDKRFYTSPIVELDLQDFAFGHIGLTKTSNVARIKQRLSPAIAELEEIGFLAVTTPATRYKKVKTGIWRVRFEPGSKRPPVEPKITAQTNQSTPDTKVAPSSTPESELVAAFYQLWSPTTPPSEQAVSQARDLIEKHGSELVQNWLPRVVKRMRSEFPDAKHFGAALPFFADIAQEHAERQEHQQRLQQEAAQRRAAQEQAKQQHASEQAFIAQWQPVWEGLTDEQRDSIRTTVLAANPGFNASPKLRQSHLVTRLCLQELANRSEASQINVADGPQTA